MEWYFNGHSRQIIRKVEPLIAWRPWNPVSVNTVYLYIPSEAYYGVLKYCEALSMVE